MTDQVLHPYIKGESTF